MKVLHIIPGAFNYFDDIKSKAFALMENLGKWGVECESSTITYGTWTKSEEAKVEAEAPKMQFQAMGTIAETLESAERFDVVHLHVPFLGEAGKIIAWRKDNPAKPFMISFYRQAPVTTIFSFYIRWYNNYFLPKLLPLANYVVCDDVDKFKLFGGSRYLKVEGTGVVVDSSEQFLEKGLDFPVPYDTLTSSEAIAYKYCLLYNTLTS